MDFAWGCPPHRKVPPKPGVSGCMPVMYDQFTSTAGVMRRVPWAIAVPNWDHQITCLDTTFFRSTLVVNGGSSSSGQRFTLSTSLRIADRFATSASASQVMQLIFGQRSISQLDRRKTSSTIPSTKTPQTWGGPGD